MIIKNSTQMPNAIIEVIPRLKPAAVRVLLVIVRFTYGWQKEVEQISFSQLGKAAGISRQAVSKGLKDLENRRLIEIRRGDRGKGANEYRLNIDISTGKVINRSKKLTSQPGSQQSRLSQINSKSIRALRSNAAGWKTRKTPPDPQSEDLAREKKAALEARERMRRMAYGARNIRASPVDEKERKQILKEQAAKLLPGKIA